MRFNRNKNTPKKTGATLGFKTGIRGRKLLRKQKRQLKKQNRASFAARLRGNNTSGTKQPQAQHIKIKQLQAVVKAEKAKLNVKKSGEAAEGSDRGNEDSWESYREEVDGFQPSTASTSERMARLQEFVNREAGVSEAASSTKAPESSEKGTDEKTNLIKDKKKLKLLRNEQKEDTKEINKLARLMRMSKPQKKKVAPIFAEDFGSLLRDIEEGTMSHADKYKGEEGDDKGGGSDREFERDMAAALGQNLGKKKKKVKTEVEKEEKSKKKVKKTMSAGNMDPENEFRASDFNISKGGNVSDDEAEEEDEYEYEDFFDDAYGDEVYNEGRKQGKSSVTARKGIDGDDGEGDESKFSSDGDGEELYSDSRFTDEEEEEEEEGYSDKIGSERRKQGKPSVIRKNIDGDDGEFNESKFSSDGDEEEEDEFNDSRFSDNEGEEDGKYEDEYDVSKFSDDEDDEENVEEEEVDDMNGYFDLEAEEDDTRGESDLDEEENIEEEEEGDENGFIDSQAEEDSEVDEESDGDGELVHDIRKEEEYAFEGGSGYYSKPEILKNGMENDIDRYSSNSDDDADLEGFVIDDKEVEYENMSDELPDELSDSPSPVRKRKKTRIVMQSDDDESEGKEKDQDESDRESEGNENKEDFFFSARGWKNRAQEAVGRKESLGARNEDEGRSNTLDTTSEESNDEDEADGKIRKGGKMKTKGKESNTNKRKLVIEDESDIMNSSPEKTSPKVRDQENDNIPQIKAKKMRLGEDEGDTATAQSEGDAQTEKKMKVEKISDDDSTMDSLVNASLLKVRKILEDENDADVSTGDSKDTRRLVKAKKKKKKKLEEKVTDDSTMDDDISQIITKKKKTKNLDENVESDSEMGDDILQVGAKKKKTKKSDENDDSTMDGDASEVSTKKKKTRKLDEDAAEDSTMDERASETSARKKKTKKLDEKDTDDSMMDDNLSQIDTKKKKKKKPDENDAGNSTMDDDASQISPQKKKGKKSDGNAADESTVNSEDTAQTKTKKKKKKRGLKDELNDDSTVDSEDVASAREKEKDEDPAGMLVVDSEDSSPIRTKKTGKRKLEEESSKDNSTLDSEDARQTKLKKKKKKIEEENEVPALKGKQSSGEEEQKTKKALLQENKTAAGELNERKPEEEKAATSRKIIPLPEISSSDEEEEDEEEVEEEEEEVEEEEDDDEDEEEEGDMGEEEEDITDRNDLEEEEEEEEEKDEEEEEEEGERREKNQNQYDATQQQKNNRNSDGEDTLTEDIYGRLRDKHGNIITRKEPEGDAGGGRYIPPALRKLTALNQSKEKRQQLAAVKRTLKGLINRLAESNMGGIASEIEGMYTKHARNDVNEVLTSLLMEAVVGPTLTPERLVQELALLVALLSANVGSEVGAHILNEFVLKWSDSMDQLSRLSSKDEIGSKELDNITLFVVHLYAFRVVEARLIYNVLHRLAQGFSEKEVELILLVLRSVGFNLRKDDFLALKAVITQIQARAAETREKATATAESRKETTGAGTSGKAGGKEARGGDEGTEYSRVTFMLETIQAVRNNNVSKLPNYDPTHMDHLRQVLRGLVRKGRQPAQLNVTLDDMLKARECGRWWVVGSAWSGGLIDEKARQNDEGVKKQKNVVLEAKFSDAFLRKAAKLQLSRPPRVNILYVLTEGSEDYLDAFEKLLQLSLPQQQEREVFSVILLCCQKGKMFNPFFSHLTDRMCKFDKKYARLLQFALWDKFEEVEGMKVREVANLAKFVTHLIAESSLSLTIFKNISFMDAERQMISLIRQVIISLLLHPAGSETVERTFSVLSASPKLKILRQSLRIFILKFIKTKKSDEDTNYAMLARRIETAVEILGHGGGVRL